MLECLILGDSIAVGTHQVRTECVAYAKGGINSWQWNKTHGSKDLAAKTVIISLGSNDYRSINTYEELHTLRQLVKADRVYWILPAIKDAKRANVQKVADKYHDIIIDSRNHELSADGVHPTYKGYKAIAKKTQGDTQ